MLPLSQEKNMDLREYLFRKRLSVTDFAKELGYQRVHISQIVNGKRKAGRHLAKTIEQFTHGEVTAHELLNPVKDTINE